MQLLPYMIDYYNKAVWTFTRARWYSIVGEVWVGEPFNFKGASPYFPQWILIFSVIHTLIFLFHPPDLVHHMSAVIPLVHRADQGDDMNPMHLDFSMAFDKCFAWCPWGCDGEMRIGSEDRKWSHSWMSNHSQECWLVFLCQPHGGL